MEQKTITVYEYMELSETVRERIKYDLVENSIEVTIGDIQQLWKEKLEKMGFINPKIRSDVSFSQGSGTSFTFDGLDAELIENTLVSCNKYDSYIFMFTKCLQQDLISVSGQDKFYRYVHENTVSIDWDTNQEIPEKLVDRIDWFIENYLEPLRLRICRTIHRTLEDNVLACYEDAFISELCTDNDWLFTANGNEV
jgi:hypothetical protein